MNFIQKLICCFLLVRFSRVNGVEYYTEKPDYVMTCKINEPGFTKCSTNAVQKLMDQLVIGIPEVVEEFGSFDPMHLKKNITFKQEGNGSANIRANLTEVVSRGFSKAIVKHSKVNKKDYSWETRIFMPELVVNANYEMDGRILLFPLRGSGKLFFKIENLDTTLHTKTHLYEKGGFTFDNVTNVRADLNMTRVRTYLSNLFNGQSEEIERSTNQFFNDNWREFYEAFKPIIVETIENVYFDSLHKVFNLLPANFFIEDIPTSEELYGKKKTR